MAVLEDLIPRCREAGVRIIWCNWGLTEKDIDECPPAVLKGFGGLNAFTSGPKPEPKPEPKLEAVTRASKVDTQANVEGEKLVDTKPSRIYRGFGTPMGNVKLENGAEIDAGRLLMRDQWNSALPPPLQDLYEQGNSLPEDRGDMWVHKNRMSGLWNENTPLFQYLRSIGIRSLLFTGVNTDQCVQGTLVDAYNSGWDCLLVRDGCGTGTPMGKEVTEWNVGRSWGFLVDSEGVKKGIDGMLAAKRG